MRALCICLVLAVGSLTAGEIPRDYSKVIVGCWLGSRKFEVYHADGTWGVKRNEHAPEDISGRRWRIKGNKLIITYPGDHGLETAVLTIVSITEHQMVLDDSGYKEELTRYSRDCQRRPNHAMEPTANRRFTQLCMISIHQFAATRALARGSSSYSR